MPSSMPPVWGNPLGMDGFEAIEFAAPMGGAPALHRLFQALGFVAVSRHRTRAITRYVQGDINFLLNEDPQSFAAVFAAQHGPCACGFALRFQHPAHEVYEQLRIQGAQPLRTLGTTGALATPVIQGIGGCMLYLVDRYGAKGTLYDQHYVPLPGAPTAVVGAGLTHIDHLTHNLYFGNMEKWARFYEELFHFQEIRYFDIKGAKTGLFSKAMAAPDGQVRIPLNESSDSKSQINEFLEQYKGEGIQHIALATEDIYATVEALRANHIPFLETPSTYFEAIEHRLPYHEEDVPRLARNQILIDADPHQPRQRLLQIFTQPVIGPIFFEVIQRKGNEGFGEGNFKALFEAIERDQQRRGVL